MGATNSTTPELLSEEVLERIASYKPFQYGTMVSMTVAERDALCQSLRALRDQLAEEQRRNQMQADTIMEYEGDVAALRDQLAQAHSDNERLALVVQGIEEREAAVCPEDIGFDEYIRTLQSRLAQVEKERDDALIRVKELQDDADVKAGYL